MKQVSFGQALPDHLREPQRFATQDPWPDVPLVINHPQPLPTLSEALTYLGSLAALVVFCVGVLHA